MPTSYEILPSLTPLFCLIEASIIAAFGRRDTVAQRVTSRRSDAAPEAPARLWSRRAPPRLALATLAGEPCFAIIYARRRCPRQRRYFALQYFPRLAPGLAGQSD